MRITRGILIMLVATLVATPTLAQIEIIPQAKRDSVANPPVVKGEDMLFVEGRTIDFGSMAEDGGNQTRKIVWQNRSERPITITRITTSCGCVRCDYTREVVKAGDKGVIAITYAPKGHPGTMRQRIFVYTDRSTQMPTAIIDIKGYVLSSADPSGDYPHAIGRLLLRNRQIKFDADSDKPQIMRIACMNGGDTDLTPVKDSMLSSPSLVLYSQPKTLRAGEQGYIVIHYTPRGRKEPLRLFVEQSNLPPRDREIRIITETEKQ